VSQLTHTGEYKVLVFLAVFVAVFVAVVVVAEGMTIEVVAVVAAEAMVVVELLKYGHLPIAIVTTTSPSLPMWNSNSKRKFSFPLRNGLKKTPATSSRVELLMVVETPTTVTTSAS
jgi:hypothetical protein